MIAERVAAPADDANAMDRGQRLEHEAIAAFEKETGKKGDSSLVMWVSEDNPNIAISPDWFMGEEEAFEAKCLNTASHIEAYYTKQIPSEYDLQKLQYFIVNKKLQKLHFGFYDPRIPSKPFFYYTVSRKDVEAEIPIYLAEQLRIIKEVERMTLELTGF